MMGFIISIHLIVCALLIIIILIQRGRGGGLVESFSGVESMFGPKTNTFLTRTTTILSTLFFITCLSLAFLSAQQARSLMRGIKIQEPLKEELPIQSTQEPSPPTQSTQETPVEDAAKTE